MKIDHIQLAMPFGEEEKARSCFSEILEIEFIKERRQWVSGKMKPSRSAGVIATPTGVHTILTKLTSEKIAIENINVPGLLTNVNADKYNAMKIAFLNVLPTASPGLNQKEIREMVKAHLPEALFPQGKTAGWWAKAVQLDLEAKGIVVRENCKPLRWYKLSDR